MEKRSINCVIEYFDISKEIEFSDEAWKEPNK